MERKPITDKMRESRGWLRAMYVVLFALMFAFGVWFFSAIFTDPF